MSLSEEVTLGHQNAVGVSKKETARREPDTGKVQFNSPLAGSVFPTPHRHGVQGPYPNSHLPNFGRIANATVHNHSGPAITFRQAGKPSPHQRVLQGATPVYYEYPPLPRCRQSLTHQRVIRIYLQRLDRPGEPLDTAIFVKQRLKNLDQSGKCIAQICGGKLHLKLPGPGFRRFGQIRFHALDFCTHLSQISFHAFQGP